MVGLNKMNEQIEYYNKYLISLIYSYTLILMK